MPSSLPRVGFSPPTGVVLLTVLFGVLLALFFVSACSDYNLVKPEETPSDSVPVALDSPPPDSSPVDSPTPGDSIPEESPPDSPPEDSPESQPDPRQCDDGYYADYFNLPANHPDVEGESTGLVPGDLPSNHDWWDPPFYAFTVVDPGLEFGEDWWPVDEGLVGDPQYFAVHWVATLEVSSDTVATFEMGSDDDGWAFIDGALVADLGGIHGVEETAFFVPLTAGFHELELYMAERHTYGSGFWFRWVTEGVAIYGCPEDTGG